MNNFSKVDLAEAYKMLEGCQVILVCTKGAKEGQYNVTPYGWFTTYDYEPVTKILFSSDPSHQACANIKRTNEYAICIPKDNNDPLIFKCGEISSPDADKYAQFNIKAEKATQVDAKILTEISKGFIECKLDKIIPEGSVELYLGHSVAAFKA